LLTIGSLYSGIAGLELGVLAALVEAGLPTRLAWQCEIDPFCSRVLAHHFPDVQRFSDVATVSHPPVVEILCGGFACQDVSGAGLGKGLGVETRSGFTLHHLLRIIDEIAPEYLVVENVASGAKRWLPRVVSELRLRGYRPRAVPLGAVDVGARHRRQRVFIVAHGHGHGCEGERRGRLLDRERAPLGDDAHGRRGAPGALLADPGTGGRGPGASVEQHAGPRQPDAGERRALPDAQRLQLRDKQGRRSGARRADAGELGDHGPELADTSEPGRARTHGGERSGRALVPERRGDAGSDGRSSQPGMGGDSHGLPFDVAGHAFPAGRGEAQENWEPPRAVAGKVKVPDRPAKLRALGNAVVPQCGLVVGRMLVSMMRAET
jgi:site-specific DNA-cytosine methylase